MVYSDSWRRAVLPLRPSSTIRRNRIDPSIFHEVHLTVHFHERSITAVRAYNHVFELFQCLIPAFPNVVLLSAFRAVSITHSITFCRFCGAGQIDLFHLCNPHPSGLCIRHEWRISHSPCNIPHNLRSAFQSAPSYSILHLLRGESQSIKGQSISSGKLNVSVSSHSVILM